MMGSAGLLEFSEYLKKMVAECENAPPAMSLLIDEEIDSVELVLDTQRSYYGDWIEGEGGDICLYRDQDTNKVLGCRFPLHQKRLVFTRLEK